MVACVFVSCAALLETLISPTRSISNQICAEVEDTLKQHRTLPVTHRAGVRKSRGSKHRQREKNNKGKKKKKITEMDLPVCWNGSTPAANEQRAQTQPISFSAC